MYRPTFALCSVLAVVFTLGVGMAGIAQASDTVDENQSDTATQAANPEQAEPGTSASAEEQEAKPDGEEIVIHFVEETVPMDPDLKCRDAAPIGSRIKRTICYTRDEQGVNAREVREFFGTRQYSRIVIR